MIWKVKFWNSSYRYISSGTRCEITQVNSTAPYQWEVNISAGSGLVPLGCWPRYMSPNDVTKWMRTVSSGKNLSTMRALWVYKRPGWTNLNCEHEIKLNFPLPGITYYYSVIMRPWSQAYIFPGLGHVSVKWLNMRNCGSDRCWWCHRAMFLYKCRIFNRWHSNHNDKAAVIPSYVYNDNSYVFDIFVLKPIRATKSRRSDIISTIDISCPPSNWQSGK